MCIDLVLNSLAQADEDSAMGDVKLQMKIYNGVLFYVLFQNLFSLSVERHFN